MGLQTAAYYGGMLAYYWVLATPTIGFLFGCYLYVCVNWFHLHYDEAFSSLRIPHYKGFSRLHITPQGTLHIYSLGIDKVRCHGRSVRIGQMPTSHIIEHLTRPHRPH